jgi:hypothetical protein
MTEGFLASYIALWILVVGLGALVLMCIRQLGEVYLIGSGLRGIAGDGLDEGRRGHDLRLALLNGEETTLREVLPRGGVLVFASRKCQVCKVLVPRLGAIDIGPRVIVAYDELPSDISKETSERSGPVLARVLDADASLKYKVRVTPFAFALTADLQVHSKGLVNTAEQVAFHLTNLFRRQTHPAVAAP